MIIAIPLENGQLSEHFGHCSSFALVQTDASNAITERRDHEAPPHQPGAFPAWLAEQGVNLLICGSMGPRAQTLLTENGIEVVMGAPVDTPENLIAAHFQGTLEKRASTCHH
ncbi:MAG: NifB/NifX family molybdenum-iron cluster-binding protein [Alphaproteobacteria bacterium]